MTKSPAERPDLHGFPLMVLLNDRKVVVVGGGHIATRKVETLLTGNANNITVVSPEVSDELARLEQDGIVKIVYKKFEDSDIDDAYFVVTATDDAQVNRNVYEAGEKRKIFVNSADDPVNCSSILMSTVRQGDITIAISTAGKSPAFAKWCGKYLRSRLTQEYTTLIEMVNVAREEIRSKGISSEDINWDPIFDFEVVRLVSENKLDEVKEIIDITISTSLKENNV